MNARSEAGHPVELEAQTRLFHGGRQIYAGKPQPLTAEGQVDPKRLAAGGSMKLDPDRNGDYVLQVIVTGKLAQQKYQTASQAMDFEIQ
ncbi:MAG TPA: hypothetical protein VE959_29805 [Bryobacteraceae bacterium]|nr:hypothetical protein [Bryobacteraceae bacterium]